MQAGAVDEAGAVGGITGWPISEEEEAVNLPNHHDHQGVQTAGVGNRVLPSRHSEGHASGSSWLSEAFTRTPTPLTPRWAWLMLKK